MNQWTTNPYDWTEETKLELMQEACFYWMTRSDRLRCEKEALLQILEDNGVNVTMKDLLDMMNKIAKETQWEKHDEEKTTS